MTISFNKETMLLFKQKLERIDSKETLLLSTLTLAQKQFGFLSDEVIKYVSQLLQMPEARVVEVVSFYSMFQTKPPPKIRLEFCNNLTCQMKGMHELKRYALERARELSKQTTGDIEIAEVACLGCCDKAPVAILNGERQEETLTKEKVEALLAPPETAP